MNVTSKIDKLQLTIGTRVYNNGDMANVEHFGTITSIKGHHVGITPDADSDRDGEYFVPASMFCEKYLGHGGTRFVTEEAYKTWHEERLAAMKAEYDAVIARQRDKAT